MQTPPCKFFNTQNGCKFTAEECKRPHEPFCTKAVCVKINKSHTHSVSTCGIKSPKESDAPAKPMSKTISETRTAICEKIFVKVEKILKETEVDLAGVVDFKPSAAKIVGMFYEGLDLKELTGALVNDHILQGHMADAVDVLRAAHAVMHG